MKYLHHYIRLLLLFLSVILLSRCVKDEEFTNDSRGNFEALWRIMDEHYCFFSEKEKQFGLDWNAVYQRYSKQINPQMTEEQLFEVLGNMLGELRDGHVNLITSFDIARNWSWHEDYPANLNDSLISSYLGKDYRISNGMKYRLLDDNIGYIRCSTFENGFGSGNLTDILSYFLTARGLIIDIRNNGGGMISSAEELAARFTNKDICVGYIQHKKGRGHNDFSEMKAQWLRPSRGLRWQKPVVVLTNRGVYSAANEFVKYMKSCPKVTIVGDRTGGGAGMPFSSELPNGWSVRFSACPIYDKDKQTTEFGIAPDVQIGLNQFDIFMGYDSIIEQARKILR
jgi:carboxyl-protease-related protein